MRPLIYGLSVAGLSLGIAACSSGTKVDPINADDISQGSPSAKIEVIEYASAACSHCAEFDREVYPQFKAKYIDTGQVRYALRELITPPEAYAVGGFLLARCAGRDKYFPVLESVYRAQQLWADQARANQTPDLRTPLVQVAATAGMSETDFQKCVGDDKAIDALNKRVAKNQVVTNHQGTPIFYVNGKQPFPNGVPTMDAIDKAIAAAKAAK